MRPRPRRAQALRLPGPAARAPGAGSQTAAAAAAGTRPGPPGRRASVPGRARLPALPAPGRTALRPGLFGLAQKRASSRAAAGAERGRKTKAQGGSRPLCLRRPGPGASEQEPPCLRGPEPSGLSGKSGSARSLIRALVHAHACVGARADPIPCEDFRRANSHSFVSAAHSGTHLAQACARPKQRARSRTHTRPAGV